jgi:hypothetical protein
MLEWQRYQMNKFAREKVQLLTMQVGSISNMSDHAVMSVCLALEVSYIKVANISPTPSMYHFRSSPSITSKTTQQFRKSYLHGHHNNIYHISNPSLPFPNHHHNSLTHSITLPHSMVHRNSTLLQLNIPLPLSLVRNTPMLPTTVVRRTIEPLPHPMHPHTPINNLQQHRHRQRQRKENV